ncbi:Metallo-dependent phosphatase-like protein [Cunninghamella echinulata]|nr:Metallo-dependent phosphatase-like protein [Cunninghamella echinulata]
MKIAIEGCCHGELDDIYGSIKLLEQRDNCKIDLVLICGDFQAVRNKGDLECMSVPLKYRALGTFWKYYAGLVKAPYPTIFIGGNHEASNYLWELYHGGWVCENIYYLGNAGVINYNGIRIGGLSGIYNKAHYDKGHYETLPYSPSHIKSIYHVREYDVQKLLQIQKPMDIFLSHDWPRGVERYGDLNSLLLAKKYFYQEVLSNTLGSLPNEQLLTHLKPNYWFAAHLHVKYSAYVNHNEWKKVTRFLSLDKCLPRRQFLQVIDIPSKNEDGFTYDLEWLAITRAMHPYLSLDYHSTPLPPPQQLQQ